MNILKIDVCWTHESFGIFDNDSRKIESVRMLALISPLPKVENAQEFVG